MAGFIIRKGEDENDVMLAELTNTTIAIGDLVFRPAGLRNWQKATTAAAIKVFQLKGVALEAIATAADSTIKIRLVNPLQLWEVESANNSNVTHNGQRQILTDENTVNNTGTDSASSTAIVVQVNGVGAVADKKLLVRFGESTGFDPDATA